MFGTRDDDDEFRETRRSSIGLTRRSSSWHLASVAGLLVALGTGCKDSNGGRGPEDDPDGSLPDGGEGSPEASLPDGSGPDADIDTGIIGGDAGTDGATDPDTGNPGDTDAGTDAGGTGQTILNKNSIEFGLSPCGGDAPASQTFTLTNSGTAAVTWSVALSSTSSFSVAGAAGGTFSGTAAPGSSATVTINASAVPATATAGQAITATATITTNLPAPNNSVVVPLSIVPQGAHLQLNPVGGADWLLVQAGSSAAPQTLQLQNAGNIAAPVTVTQPTVSEFALQSNGQDVTDLTVPAATNATTPGATALTATFAPQVIGPFVSTAALNLGDTPVCNGGASGASITSIPFEGAATGFGFTAVATTALPDKAFCGATGDALPKATITVGNATGSALVVGVTLNKSDSSPFTITQSALNIAPGTTATFDAVLKVSEVPANAVPRTSLNDLIILTPAVGSGFSAITVPLTTTVTGAQLAWVNSAAPDPLPFTGANNQTVATNSILVRNTGNWPASPTFSFVQPAPEVFSVTGALSPSAVPAGTNSSPGESTLGLTFRPIVNDVAAKAGAISIAAGTGDVICGALPAAINLSGTPSTPGFAVVNALPIQFGTGGLVDCPLAGAGADFAAGYVDVQLRNDGQTQLTWTAAVAAFPNAPGYTLDALTGSISANGGTGTIRVTPNALPWPPSLDANAYGGTLTITTNIANDEPHVIDLVQTAHGSVYEQSTSLPDFGGINVTAAPPPNAPLFTIKNVGNAIGTVRLTSNVNNANANSVPVFTVGSTPIAKSDNPAGVTYGASVDPALDPVVFEGTFDPVLGSLLHGDDDLVLSTLTTRVSALGPVCGVLPPNFDIVGTGTNAVFNLTPFPNSTNPLRFPESGDHSCGSNRAAEPRTLIVTNYGNIALTITDLRLDSEAWFGAYITTPGNKTKVVPAATGGEPGTAVIVIAPKLVGALGGPANTTSTTLHVIANIDNVESDVPVPLVEYLTCTTPP